MGFNKSFGTQSAAIPFDLKFFNPRTTIRSWGISLDVKSVPYEKTALLSECDPSLLGTMVSVDSGRRLLELGSEDGMVTIRNAKIEYLDDNKVRIEFDRSEQE